MKIGKDGQSEDLLKDEPVAEAAEEAKKRTLREKAANFWYFHKWHLLIGVVAAVIAAVIIMQTAGNVSPDAYILFVGKATVFPKDKDAIAETAGREIYDQNGDGNTHVAFLDITVAVGENIPYTAYQTNVDANKRFMTEITSGDSVIYLLEESFFEKASEQGVLCPLAQIIDPALLPDDMYDEYGVRVSELDYFTLNGFSSIPDDTVLCIRRSPEQDSITYGRTIDYWECNKTLFVKMFEYRAEDKAEKQISAFDKGNNDIVIGVYDPARHYETDGAKLAYAASSVLKDINSDGRTLLALDAVLTTGKYAEERLASQVAEGDEVIFIANEEYYEKLKQSGILRPLEEIMGNYASRLGSEDGYGIKLSALKWFGEKQFFKDFDGGLYICLAKYRGEGEEDAFYKGNAAFLLALASYKIDQDGK